VIVRQVRAHECPCGQRMEIELCRCDSDAPPPAVDMDAIKRCDGCKSWTPASRAYRVGPGYVDSAPITGG
jgi:hypothetical protein